MALFSATSFDPLSLERTKTIGDTIASGEFYVIAVRWHFDKRTIGPRREATGRSFRSTDADIA